MSMVFIFLVGYNWHLNHWKIRIDDIDEYGNDIVLRVIQNYVIMNGLELKH
jgi:hypothetical protein